MSAYTHRLVNRPSAMNFTPSADNNVCCDMGVINKSRLFFGGGGSSLSISAAWSRRGNLHYPEFHTVTTGFPYLCPGSVLCPLPLRLSTQCICARMLDSWLKSNWATWWNVALSSPGLPHRTLNLTLAPPDEAGFSAHAPPRPSSWTLPFVQQRFQVSWVKVHLTQKGWRGNMNSLPVTGQTFYGIAAPSWGCTNKPHCSLF